MFESFQYTAWNLKYMHLTCIVLNSNSCRTLRAKCIVLNLSKITVIITSNIYEIRFMLKQIDSAKLFRLYVRIIWICCMKLETHEFDRSCERLARRSSGDPTTRKSTPTRFRRVFHRNARRRPRRVYQAARARLFPACEAVVRERMLGIWKRSRQLTRVWCAAEPKPSSGSCLTMAVLLKWGFVRCSVTPLTPAKP